MRLCRTFIVALIALLIVGMGMASPASAQVDQCAPPGIESASALPTNLAAAARGPAEDRYTTATVPPLDRIDVNALGLSVPGTLTVGTLSDAPPRRTGSSVSFRKYCEGLRGRHTTWQAQTG
jgi:polar amino acid transport system substrate-binding protein